MQDIVNYDVVSYDNPFTRPKVTRQFYEGMSISDIVRELSIDTRLHFQLQVTISSGDQSSIVPITSWSNVYPRKGCHIQIRPVVHGDDQTFALLATLVIAAAAPGLAAYLFPTFTSTKFGLALATAGVSVIGTLAVRALIPPPNILPDFDPIPTIEGGSNNARPYAVYPTVLGRHLMHPVSTATGYTEGTHENGIYLHQRMTFGYGPIALSDIKIGTTPITDFEGIEIEFLNVDRQLTLAAMPSLSDTSKITIRGWRYNSEPMTLYPDDIVDNQYSLLLEPAELSTGALLPQSIVRRTAVNTVSASFDITFPEGLGSVYDGRVNPEGVYFNIFYKEADGAEWVRHRPSNGVNRQKHYHTAASKALVRFTHNITFPSAGVYDIRVERLRYPHPVGSPSLLRNPCYLTAIRSIQAGGLPSHPNISEIALKIKASDHLDGQIKNLNAIVQQLAPVWDGTSWSPPQPVRHPAWQYARALMGPQLRDPVTSERIDLNALKTWADDEPHWTCDIVIDKKMRLTEALDLICACGRARRALSDLKYSVTRDGAAGGVVQHFTPRTSWGFKGRKYLDRDIHGFHVRIISEHKNWATDDITVYADGYDHSNAVDFETLKLPGVVLTKDTEDQGNAYRLARYNLAVAKLRPEEFTFNSDLDHIPCQMGDKIRIVHDTPLFGVGSGRVKEADSKRIVIDEWEGVPIPVSIHSQLTPTATIAPRSFSGGGFTTSFRERSTVFSGTAVLPENPEDRALFEHGGASCGTFLGVRDNGTIFRLRSGYGGLNVDTHNRIALLDIPITRLPFDGHSHTLTWECNPVAGTVRLWVDGISYGTGRTQEGWTFPGKQWSYNAGGLWGAGTNGVNVTGEPKTPWNYGTGDLTAYDNQTIGDVEESIRYRLTIRRSNGDLITTNALHLGRGAWSVADPLTVIPQPDDLVMIEQISSSPVELLVTKVVHSGELKAEITAIPAAPEVLDADTGIIPEYDPQITKNDHLNIVDPEIVQVFSGASAADGNNIRIGVEVTNPSYAGILTRYHQLRWRQVGADNWELSDDNLTGMLLFTGILNEGVEYEIEVRAITASGGFSNWVSATVGTHATLTYDVPFDVVDFEVSVFNNYATFSWRSIDTIPNKFHIRYSRNRTSWENATDVRTNIEGSSFNTPVVNGYYMIKAFSQTNAQSLNASVVEVRSSGNENRNIVVDVGIQAPFTGTLGEGVTVNDNHLIFEGSSEDKYYTLPDYVDTGIASSIRLVSSVVGKSYGSSSNIFDIANMFDIHDVFNVKSLDDWVLKFEEQHTSDDPSSSDAVWSNWNPLLISDYTARAFRFRLVSKSDDDALLYVKLLSAIISIDVPERIEFGIDVRCPEGGITISFNNGFYDIPSVVIDSQDLPEGAVKHKTVTRTGFTLEYTNGTNDPIPASFDWHAIGYGKNV